MNDKPPDNDSPPRPADCCQALREANAALRKRIDNQVRIITRLKKYSARSYMVIDFINKLNVHYLKELTEIVVSESAWLFNAAKAALFLYEKETDQLYLASNYPISKEPPAKENALADDAANNDDTARRYISLASDTLLAFVANNCKGPQLIADPQSYGETCRMQFTPDWTDKWTAARSLVVPLAFGAEHGERQLQGVLAAAQATFNTEDLALGKIIGEVLAVNLNSNLLLAKMRQLANTDGLTGLSNHLYFQKRLQSTIGWCRGDDESFCLLMIDLDNFKKLNDKYKHQAGDYVLSVFGKLLQNTLRSKIDLAARYGGEEFAVILSYVNLAEALVVAERIRQLVAHKVFNFRRQEIRLTVSIGVAEYTLSLSASELIEQSDRALYQAKEQGRNQVVAYTPKEVKPSSAAE